MEKDFYSMEELNSLFNSLENGEEDDLSIPTGEVSIPVKTVQDVDIDIDIEGVGLPNKPIQSVEEVEEAPAEEEAPVEEEGPVAVAELSSLQEEPEEALAEEPKPETLMHPETLEQLFGEELDGKKEEPENEYEELLAAAAPEARPAESASMEVALSAYRAGNYVQAATQLANLTAGEENYRAARLLGDMCANGLAPVDSFGGPMGWYCHSMILYQMQLMEAGEDVGSYDVPSNRLGFYRLAMCYALGNGVNRRPKRAIALLKKAELMDCTPEQLTEKLVAELTSVENRVQAEPTAEELLAMSELLFLGEVNPHNYESSHILDYIHGAERKLMKQSGPSAAQLGRYYYMMGVCQMYGYGCIKNKTLSRAYWEEAARLGDEGAAAALNALD